MFICYRELIANNGNEITTKFKEVRNAIYETLIEFYGNNYLSIDEGCYDDCGEENENEQGNNQNEEENNDNVLIVENVAIVEDVNKFN